MAEIWDEVFRQLAPAGEIEVKDCVPILMAAANMADTTVSRKALEEAVQEKRPGFPKFPKPLDRIDFEEIMHLAFRRDSEADMNLCRNLGVEEPTAVGDGDAGKIERQERVPIEKKIAEVFHELAPSGKIEQGDCVPILIAAAPMIVECTVSHKAVLAALDEKLSGSRSKPIGLNIFLKFCKALFEETTRPTSTGAQS